jgi:hypothetical protein
MIGQGVLGLELGDGSRSGHALTDGLERTLRVLADERRLRPEHASLVERARFFAYRAETSGGIAATNWGKLYAETESQILALEAPADEEADESGNRVTKLSEFIRARRDVLAGADVPHTEAS